MPSTKPVVLVTGSSGLIGSALVPALARKYRVVGFDRYTPPHPPAQAECICVDLGNKKDLEAAFKRVRLAYGSTLASVVHLAAYYDFSGKPSPKYQKVTVRGTRRLLEHLADFKVEQFLFTSTILVHSPGKPGRRIDEDQPIDPKWDYPESKVETEELLRQNAGDMRITVLRLAGVYDEKCHSPPIASQVQRIFEGRLDSRFYPGDTRTGQSFLHLDDCVSAIAAAVNHRRKLPQLAAYLIGESETLPYAEIQSIASHHLRAWERPTRHIPKPLAKAGAMMQLLVPGRSHFIRPWMVDRANDHYELDTGKAQKELGWQAAHSLRDELPAILERLRQDPATWYKDNHLRPPPSLTRLARPMPRRQHGKH